MLTEGSGLWQPALRCGVWFLGKDLGGASFHTVNVMILTVKTYTEQCFDTAFEIDSLHIKKKSKTVTDIRPFIEVSDISELLERRGTLVIVSGAVFNFLQSHPLTFSSPPFEMWL